MAGRSGVDDRPGVAAAAPRPVGDGRASSCGAWARLPTPSGCAGTAGESTCCCRICKYALSALVKKPGFTAIAILTLAVGIGGNAAIFSAVRAVLLRPLPFPSPDELVEVFSTSVKSPQAMAGTASPPDFTDWRRENTSFTELAAINAGAYAMTGPGLPAEQITGASVTGGFFNVLRVDPLYGRTLSPEDDATGGPLAAVLGHTLWSGGSVAIRRSSAGPSPSTRNDYRIVGIMPRGFCVPACSPSCGCRSASPPTSWRRSAARIIWMSSAG